MPAVPPQPPVRPLPDEPADPPPRARRRAWVPWLAVAAGLVGATAGLLLGLGIAGERDVPPTTGVTLSSLPPDLAAPGFVEPTTTTTTTTTAPPPSTTTTTRADPAPPLTLGEMVPGLDGTMVVAETRGNSVDVLRWRVGEAAPDRFRLPPGAARTGFDAAAEWTATLQTVFDAPRPGRTLLLAGPDMDFQPFDTGVADFAWHPTAPHRLAWIRIAHDGSLELWSGEVPGPLEGLRRVAEVEPAAEGPDPMLLVWGDWGFALYYPAARQTVTIGPEGQTLGALTGVVRGASPDGRLLMSVLPADRDGVGPDHAFTDPAFTELEPIGRDVGERAVWSDDGTRLATVSLRGVGSVLWIEDGDRAFETVLDAEIALPLAWAGGDRFVVAWADGVRTRFAADPDAPAGDREQRRPALLFIDTADRSATAIAVSGPVADVGFRVAS